MQTRAGQLTATLVLYRSVVLATSYSMPLLYYSAIMSTLFPLKVA